MIYMCFGFLYAVFCLFFCGGGDGWWLGGMYCANRTYCRYIALRGPSNNLLLQGLDGCYSETVHLCHLCCMNVWMYVFMKCMYVSFEWNVWNAMSRNLMISNGCMDVGFVCVHGLYMFILFQPPQGVMEPKEKKMISWQRSTGKKLIILNSEIVRG